MVTGKQSEEPDKMQRVPLHGQTSVLRVLLEISCQENLGKLLDLTAHFTLILYI